MDAFDCDVPNLDCGVCRLPLSDAKILPCHHIFCRVCVEMLIQQHDPAECETCSRETNFAPLDHLRCPSCKVYIDIDLQEDLSNGSGVDRLPGHTIVNNAVSIIRMLEEEGDLMEGGDVFSDIDQPMASRPNTPCGDNGQRLDDRAAVEYHMRQLDDEPSLIGNTFALRVPSHNPCEIPMDNRSVLPCDSHNQQAASVYCDTCSQTSCSECTLKTHRDHYVSILRDVLSTSEEVSREFLAEAPDNIGFVQDRIDLTRRMANQVDTSMEEVVEKVKMVFQRIKNALDQREENLMGHIHTVKQIRALSFEQRLTNLEQVRDNMELAVKDIELALQWRTDPDLLKSRSVALKRAKEIEQLKWHPFPHKDDVFNFTAPDASLMSSIGLFGILSSCGFGPKSRVTGAGLRRAAVNRVASFTVMVSDHMGEPLRMGGDLVEAVVLSARGGQLNSRVVDCQNGTYGVYYEPTEEIKHWIHVSVRGVPVPGSPFGVAVHQSRDYGTVGDEVIFSFGGPGNRNGELCRPWGIDSDAHGRIVVSDRSNDRIQVFDELGSFLLAFGTTGQGPGKLFRPAGVAVDNRSGDDSRIVVADKDNHRVQVFSFRGQLLAVFGERGSRGGQFHYPWDVAVNQESHQIAVTDSRNYRVQLFSPEGRYMARFGFETGCTKELDCPRGIAFDREGNAIVTDFNNHRLVVLDRNFHFSRFIGCPGHGVDNFLRPQGIAVDPEGNILVADSKNQRIVVLTPDGGVLKVFGHDRLPAGVLGKPMGLCVSPDGLLYVVDFESSKVLVF